MKGLEFVISELNRKKLVAEHFPGGLIALEAISQLAALQSEFLDLQDKL